MEVHILKKNSQKKTLQNNFTGFEYKQVLVIRVDLKMSKGKIAVQAAHAAIGAAEKARQHHQSWWSSWLREGQKKVVELRL